MPHSTRIWTPLDFEKPGKQADSLRLPISVDDSAYGWFPIPVVSIKNGGGPTAVLLAGTHGDEYEGQLALMHLARTITPSEVNGRIIIVPSLNFPAVEAGRRVSPIDEGNLNRLYPGDAHGTATRMIAHYVTEVLLPMADLVIDLHSGGHSLDYVQCALIRPGATKKEHEALLELLKAFGAPIGYLTDGSGGGGNTTLPAAAETHGVPVITTELGGGATLSQGGKALAINGTLRLLNHLRVLDRDDIEPAGPVRLMEVPGTNYFAYAEATGFFEPLAAAGDNVEAGQLIGLMHTIDRPCDEPRPVLAPQSGLVACRRFPTLARRGDCLFGLMRDV